MTSSPSFSEAKGGEDVNNNSSLKKMTAFYVNNYVSVQVFPIQTVIGKVQKIGIRRHDGKANVTWSEKQRIKNELFGKDAQAIEVFPATCELIDEANMYWLWILPKEYKLPFSLK